ncbi:MAG: hypothetical protein K5770_11895 [Lachnospiraceae bacterium]|nr:hypothetical protein [Lachnospiraceae bacterium]
MEQIDYSKIRFYGRGTRLFEDGRIPLFTSGSGFALRTDSPEVTMTYTADFVAYEPWFAIWIDGVLVARQAAQRGRHEICLYRNFFSTGEVRTIRVTKETQAFHEDPSSSFIIDSIDIAGRDAKLYDLPGPRYYFEVIGDSITSGEGTYGRKKAMEWIPAYFSYERTYEKRLEDLMDADISTLSVSGWGVVCSYENNPDGTLPGIYEKVCGTALGKINTHYGADDPYDFSRKNDAVIISLGTNDAGSFEKPAFVTKDGRSFQNRLNEDGSPNKEDVERFTQGAVDFLKTVHEHNPDAFLLWVYGQVGDLLALALEKAVSQFTEETGYRRAAFLKLLQMTEETEGSREHPGAASQTECARRIAEFLGGKLSEDPDKRQTDH